MYYSYWYYSDSGTNGIYNYKTWGNNIILSEVPTQVCL